MEVHTTVKMSYSIVNPYLKQSRALSITNPLLEFFMQYLQSIGIIFYDLIVRTKSVVNSTKTRK